MPATLCVPDLPGPLPAVVYNHGGLGDKIGGAPAETCAALAQAGYVGFSPIRRQTVQMEGHLDDVMAAIDYVLALEYVDGSRLGVMGFSRGGFLTFTAATRRPDFAAVVIMAPAPARGPYAGSLSQGSNITAPVLFLVAENDTVQADHIASTQSYYDAIASGGNQPELIVYPPYGNDGHNMFFEIGAYWADVVRFLDANLAIQSY